MEALNKKEFCINCRKETGYNLKKQTIVKRIKNHDYRFEITMAVCSNCGEEMSLPGLIDRNTSEIDGQYREIEGIVSIDDIEKLLKIYNIGKAPASLALGFGEVTISRYLAGQIPSKEYSDVIRKALTSPQYMKGMLEKNKKTIGKTAYNKAVQAASSLEDLFTISNKMLQVIAYVFKALEEVTPLSLQKLLYFVQGVHLGLYGRPCFIEDCRAWIHGPVYTEVYQLFKGFSYNPIDDARFAVFESSDNSLTERECGVIDLVVKSFGMYGGKTLERITHHEDPWINARRGYPEDYPSDEIILKKDIQSYFESIHRKYGIDSEKGLKNYIASIIE